MSLVHLPDEILLEIVSHLATTQDVASVASTCRNLHSLSQEFWRSFVRTRFSALTVEPSRGHRWDQLADSLTWQSRCWERKSFLPVAYTADDRNNQSGNFFKGYRNNRGHTFSPVLDARIVYGGGFELVAWGAGEDVVGRFRVLDGGYRSANRGASEGRGDAWFRIDGARNGYEPATGDVTSIKLVEPGGRLGFLVGRASGDLRLISAERETAGKAIKSFSLPTPPAGITAASWGAVGFIDALPNQTAIVAGNRSTISLFPLCDGTATAAATESASEGLPIKASDSHSFMGSPGRPRFIHAAKALSNDTVACALGADDSPLRWLTLTPTGFTTKSIDKNSDLLSPLTSSSKTTIRALETVHPGGAGAGTGAGNNSNNLLLTAWDDGTVRLLDPRTPSPYDSVYRDCFQPDESLSSLVSWGANRFVAGSNENPHLKIFDYRWSSPPDRITTAAPVGKTIGTPDGALSYRHTDGLPCCDCLPFPRPPTRMPVSDIFRELNVAPLSTCDHSTGKMCAFHRASRLQYYRPNSCLIIEPFASARSSSASAARTRPSRIHALAKASDASPSFYVGLPGGVAEMCSTTNECAPRAVRKAANTRGWKADAARFCYLETAFGKMDVSRCRRPADGTGQGDDPDEMDEAGEAGENGYPGLGLNTFSPRLVQSMEEQSPGRRVYFRPSTPKNATWHRWDERFWRPVHFP